MSCSTTLTSHPAVIQSSTNPANAQPGHSGQASSTVKLAQRVNTTPVHHSAGSTALHEPALPSEHSGQASSTVKLAQRVNTTPDHHFAGSTALHKPALPFEGISQKSMPQPLLPSFIHSQSAGAKYHDLRHSGTQLLAGLQSRLAVTHCLFHLHHFQLYASLLQICGQSVFQLAILPALYQCGQHVPASITASLDAVHSNLDSLSTTQLKVGLPWLWRVYTCLNLSACKLQFPFNVIVQEG